MAGSWPRRAALNLRAGEWVEVRTEQEILETLDEHGCLENLPLMPEMLEYCGQRFRVFKRSDKTCDPAHTPWTIRRMKNSVHLDGVRCSGEGHGGCQAGCLIWWNEAWLKRADPNVLPEARLRQTGASQATGGTSRMVETILTASQMTNPQGDIVYSCQATNVRNFTTYMSWWDPRQYIRDLHSGNLSSGHSRGSRSERVLELLLGLLQVVRAFFISVFTERRRLAYPSVAGTVVKTSAATLDLQPGELVQVRTKEEIVKTLDKQSRNRGLLFDGEMLRYCGGIYRVLRRVDQIIDEKTGRMTYMKRPCIVLESVVCKSDFHRLCPRAIYPYWREDWLKRVDSIPAQPPAEQIAETCRS